MTDPTAFNARLTFSGTPTGLMGATTLAQPFTWAQVCGKPRANCEAPKCRPWSQGWELTPAGSAVLEAQYGTEPTATMRCGWRCIAKSLTTVNKI